MSGLHQPHDKIVKATFSDIPTACAFLQAELPPELVSQIDWSTLRLESGSQIDAEFSASSSDLLYTARLGGEPAYLYVLFEQLLRYILDRDIDKPAFRQKVKAITNPKLNQNAMSLAEQLREEGREEGRSLAIQFRQEGRQEGVIVSKQQDIVEALGIRFGSVPEGLREEVEAINDPAKLTGLFRAAIRCANIEAFAREL